MLLRVRAYTVVELPTVIDVELNEPGETSVSATVLPSVDHCTWSPLVPAVALKVTEPVPQRPWFVNAVTLPGNTLAVAVTLTQPLKQPVVLLRVRAYTNIDDPAVTVGVV